MAKSKMGNLKGSWRFRREVTLGTVLHVVVLLVMLVTAWNDLQGELTLIRSNLSRIADANAEFCGHIEFLTDQCREHEFRLYNLELCQQQKLDEIAAENDKIIKGAM